MEDGDIQTIRPEALPVPQPVSPSGSGSTPDSADLMNTADEVIILEPGQEQAQKFIKAISNQNASVVMQLLREAGPLRLSDIAEQLGMSLNATKYHIENLMDAGLLEISNTRYSIKGRKVKMYRMKNQIFIVAPSMTQKKQIISAVLKYGSFLGMYIFVAIVFLVLIPLPAKSGTIPLTGSYPQGVPAAGTAALSGVLGSYVIAMFLAAVVTIVGLILYSILINRRQSNDQSGI